MPGHWEGDLLLGTASCFRSGCWPSAPPGSRCCSLCPLTVKRQRSRDALARVVATIPAQLRRSLTWDNGKEMAEHRAFTSATNFEVFFCDPGQPWQRGTASRTPSAWSGPTSQKAKTCPTTPTSTSRVRRDAQRTTPPNTRLAKPRRGIRSTPRGTMTARARTAPLRRERVRSITTCPQTVTLSPKESRGLATGAHRSGRRTPPADGCPPPLTRKTLEASRSS